MDYGRAALADRIASAYVVGTLRGAARRRFEALLPAHAALRDATSAWQERLMPLTLAIMPEAPPARVWQRIEARIAGSAGARDDSDRSVWSRLAFWRGYAGLASIATAVLAFVLAWPAPVRPPIVVVLSTTAAPQGAAAPATFVASISGDGRAVVTKPLVNVDLRSGRALELWAIPAGGAPRSLGLISTSGATVVENRRALEGAASLAVSLEPTGGSPTGAPTGPVLYSGKLTL